MKRQRPWTIAAAASTIAVVFVLSGCSQPEPSPASQSGDQEVPTEPADIPDPTLLPLPEVLPLLVDADMGSSDVIALLYLLSSDEVDLKAITVSGTGEGYCGSGVTIARQLTELVGKPDIPIACGRDEPLRGENRFPREWRARTTQFKGLELPDVELDEDTSALELLSDTILASPSRVAVLTLGPLTNLGELISEEPGVIDRLDHLVVMGGAIDVPGNQAEESTAEWNIWIDPHAADLVFRSGIPITLIPLDATNDVPSSIFALAALGEHHETPAAQAVFDMFTADPNLYAPFYYFWDPLSAAALIDPELVETTRIPLEVIRDGPDLGRTARSDSGTEMLVALTADAERFEESLISVLNGGIPVSLPERVADIEVSFDGEQCSFEGAASVSSGSLILRAENLSDIEFGVPTLTLEAGYSVQDILDWPESVNPPWSEVVGWLEPPRGGHAFSTVDATEGPLYVVCVVEQRARAVMTPIAVGD